MTEIMNLSESSLHRVPLQTFSYVTTGRILVELAPTARTLSAIINYLLVLDLVSQLGHQLLFLLLGRNNWLVLLQFFGLFIHHLHLVNFTLLFPLLANFDVFL
jgi:hypothetical protein